MLSNEIWKPIEGRNPRDIIFLYDLIQAGLVEKVEE